MESCNDGILWRLNTNLGIIITGSLSGCQWGGDIGSAVTGTVVYTAALPLHPSTAGTSVTFSQASELSRHSQHVVKLSGGLRDLVLTSCCSSSFENVTNSGCGSSCVQLVFDEKVDSFIGASQRGTTSWLRFPIWRPRGAVRTEGLICVPPLVLVRAFALQGGTKIRIVCCN